MGLIKGLSFSLKRAVGISGLKSKIAHKTGIPTKKQGLERKIGAGILSVVIGKEKKVMKKYLENLSLAIKE
jgi:hypothetical protein